jgi:peroxiredoxin
MIRTFLPLLAALIAFAPGLPAQDRKPPRKPIRLRTVEEKVPWFYRVSRPTDPELTLPDIDGKKYRFGDLRGRTVVVSFWNPKGPWSVKADAKLKALDERYGKLRDKEGRRSVVFLAIDSAFDDFLEGDKPYAEIRKYVEKAKIPYPILIDREFIAATRFRAVTTPHVFVIDSNGYLRYSGDLDNDPKGEKEEGEVEHWLDDAIDASVHLGKMIRITETKPFGDRIQHKQVKRPMPITPGTEKPDSRKRGEEGTPPAEDESGEEGKEESARDERESPL